MNSILTTEKKYPIYTNQTSINEFILITSLNLGGAEKILVDHLWANYYNNKPIHFTVIIMYNHEKEHILPPNVTTVRLNNDIKNGNSLFQFLKNQNKQLVCHLINDTVLNYLFSFNLSVHLVLHNDQQGWNNKPHIFNHPNISSIISICHYVTRQVQQYTDKNIITLRHQIDYSSIQFSQENRLKYRKFLNINDTDIVIGMIGRIAWQKNYAYAIHTLYYLTQLNPNFKLIIVGGVNNSDNEKEHQYLSQLVSHYQLQNNIIFTGFRNDTYQIINAFDLGLNTSHYEGLSMATQELIANGLSVIAP